MRMRPGGGPRRNLSRGHFLRTAVFSAKTADSLVRHARTGTGTWRSGGLPARSISTRFQALTYVVRQSPPHVKFRLADRHVAEWRTPCSINLNSLSGIDLCRETGPPHVKFRLADQVTWRCSARQSVHCEAAPREKESAPREP